MIKEASESIAGWFPMVLTHLLLDSRERGALYILHLGDAPMEIRDPDARTGVEAHVPGACLPLLILCVGWVGT